MKNVMGFNVKEGSKFDKRLSKECKVIEIGSVLAAVIAFIIAFKKMGFCLSTVVATLATLLITGFVIIVVCAVCNIFIR